MYELNGTWCTYYAGFAQNPPRELLDLGWFTPESLCRGFGYIEEMGQFRHFSDMRAWYDYVQSLRIQPGKVVLPYLDAFDEALRALVMTYFSPGFCKLAESKALSTLEDALKMAYNHRMCKFGTKNPKEHKKCAGLGETLEWVEHKDMLYKGLADNSKGSRRPNALNVIRDRLMHGNQQEMMPWGGLFKVVKEVIEHAFRNHEPYDIHSHPRATIGLSDESDNPQLI